MSRFDPAATVMASDVEDPENLSDDRANEVTRLDQETMSLTNFSKA